VVCGRAIEADALQVAFQPFGNVQSVKLVKDKGVAYVKYDKASSAALAIESLNGAVLNNGRGPKLKVLLAEAPTARGMIQPRHIPEAEISADPDNVPPRSRLFIVVPKQAEAQLVQDEMSKFQDIEYCKTDLIASKGVVFCKFAKASSALVALEDISSSGTLSGYKVKCMLAEPKTKRGRPDGSPNDMFGPMSQAAKLEYGMSVGMDGLPLKLPMSAALTAQQIGMHEYAAIGGLSGLAGGLGGFNTLPGVNNLAEMQGLGSQVGLGFVGGLGSLQAGSPVSPNNNNSPTQLSKQRLFVVVHKGVGEDLLARLFRRFTGMEYCDLKKDRATGKSKGYCYINYSTPEAAAAAIEHLNGIEFPPHSSHRIKVMYAEPLGVRGQPSSASRNNSPAMSLPGSSPSPIHTPLSRNMSPDVASVQDTLASMSMQRVNSQSSAMDDVDRNAARLASPVASTVARELMFNVA